MKYVAAVLAFFLIWCFVTLICLFIVAALYPTGVRFGGITLSRDASVYLSLFLGVLAGLHSAKATLNPKRNKESADNIPK